MKTSLPIRAGDVIAGLICFMLLTAGWWLQYGPQQQQPCPLCILQRYAFIAVGLCLLAASFMKPRQPISMALHVEALTFALCGAGLATWQLTKGASMTSCMTDPIGVFVNGLPTANWWPQYFFATGSCADQYPPLLGLPIAGWALFWFAALALWSGFCVWQWRQSLAQEQIAKL